MAFGYIGKILHVDLTKGTLEVETPDESFYRTYMGGSAMGVYYVLRDVPKGADPLGPENVLALFASVTTGAPISGQSRLNANAKSPISGAIGDSQAGGYFPAELKFAGFDGIVIKEGGKARLPWILDGKPELRDASQLMGKITKEVDEILREELGDKKIEILQHGPAAEQGVLFSSIVNMSSRQNGRTGMGLVMASKNLKAVVVHGKQKVRVADPRPDCAGSHRTQEIAEQSGYGQPGQVRHGRCCQFPEYVRHSPHLQLQRGAVCASRGHQW
jgi:aldehyde:ferredoxin oxidoreductase